MYSLGENCFICRDGISCRSKRTQAHVQLQWTTCTPQHSRIVLCTASSTFHVTQFLLPPPALGFEVILWRFTKTRRRQHAFIVRVVPYWNKLPEDIVTATSVETLKFRLDAQWQSFFPEFPLSPVPQYSLPYLFHLFVSHPMLLV